MEWVLLVRRRGWEGKNTFHSEVALNLLLVVLKINLQLMI
jgi:hypothetical protein